MISATEFRRGTKILFKDEPYSVVSFQWTKPGKGGAYIKTKMKNMITNLMREETFRADQKLPQPDMEYKEMQYLYKDGELYNFMNQETFEQVAFNREQLDDVFDYLKEESVYTILYFNDRPISAAAPLFMELKVAETMPGERGNTAQGGATKPATLETGLVLQVPLFVDEGDIIKVDTRDDKYIERVK